MTENHLVSDRVPLEANKGSNLEKGGKEWRQGVEARSVDQERD